MLRSIRRAGSDRLKRAASHALRSLPGRSSLLGAPRGPAVACSEWSAQNQAACRYTRIHPPIALHRAVPPPGNEGSVAPEFTAEMMRTLPETFVLELSDVRQCGDNGEVITPDDRILSDLSSTFGEVQALEQRIYLGRPQPVRGRTAVLAVPGGTGYFHWMLDLLPRFRLLELGGMDFENVIINPALHDFQKETLARLLPTGKDILPASSAYHYRLERAVLPSRVSLMGNPPPWVCEFLRERLLPASGRLERRRRRVYASRGDARWRPVSNEREIVESLRARGFEEIVLSKLSVSDQAELFRCAEVIVSPHGGGLTNLVFCEAGTKVVEFFPRRALNVCYWSLANVRGLEYSYVVDPDDHSADWGAPVQCSPSLIHEALDSIGI